MGRVGDRIRRGARTQKGAVAIMMALTLAGLLIVGGIVLDFGVVRMERQSNRSATDDAVMAGLRAADGGTDKIFNVRGVCATLAFLKANRPALTGLPPTLVSGGSCPNDTSAQVCVPNDGGASAVNYHATTTSGTSTFEVWIRSPYDTTDTVGGYSWPEESLSSVSADTATPTQHGCDQIGVIVKESTTPGLGRLVTSHKLVTWIRSVGRVAVGSGDSAPALLLLKRTGCPVLETGSNSGGSFIHVKGAVSTGGKSQPGTIHADADGHACTGGSNQNIFLGRSAGGVVAYAAPLVSNPSSPDPAKPGQISSFAGNNGVPVGSPIVSDGVSNVYGSGALDPSGAPAATKTSPAGRDLVTRKPVDDRYLAGVTAAVTGAQSSVFGSVNAGNAGSSPFNYQVVHCSGSGVVSAPLPPLTAADKLFVDCTSGLKSIPTVNAGTVVFNGPVKPSTAVSMPNATHVYIFGSSSDAMILNGSSSQFNMHTSGNLDGLGHCKTTQSSSDKAVLFVKDGDIKESNNALLQLCYTTVYMMGGQSDGCLPTAGYATAPAPTLSPCTLGFGTGQLSQTGGDVDWTAPNADDVMTLGNGDPNPALAPDWSDPNGQEDLAFWSESAGANSNPTYNMAGGGNFRVQGVYMVPNADPFTISGGASQILTDAQYIATSIALNGTNTNITMSVDANAAVTIPQLDEFLLVR